jgi:hypothetical protein
MKTRGLYALIPSCLALLLAISCSGQQQRKDEKQDHSKPDIRYKVDKKYDSRGNVISYDSSYTYSFRSGSTTAADSVFNRLFAGFERSALSPFIGRYHTPGDSATGRIHLAPFDGFWNEHAKRMDSLMRTFMRDVPFGVEPVFPEDSRTQQESKSHHL